MYICACCMLGYDMLGVITSFYVISCHVMSWYIRRCHIVLLCAVLYHAISGCIELLSYRRAPRLVVVALVLHELRRHVGGGADLAG